MQEEDIRERKRWCKNLEAGESSAYLGDNMEAGSA